MSNSSSRDDMRVRLSVVIPTLGGPQLVDTIRSINAGSIYPSEILVCIPEASGVTGLENFGDNVKVISTKSVGQVPQRAEGFEHAAGNVVLQVDDDFQLSHDCLEILWRHLRILGHGNVVGPAFYDSVTKRSLHEYRKGLAGFFKSVNAFVFAAAPWGERRMGRLTSLGIAYGFDPEIVNQELVESEWLPGGCVLGYKDDLVVERFFPFSGKAFSEDVMHSLLRRRNGVRHFVATKARAMTRVESEGMIWRGFAAELKARRHVVSLLRGSILRFYVWAVSQIIVRVLKWSV